MRKEGDKFPLRMLLLISQIGITMIVCIGAGVWFGGWLDGKLGTKGICLIIFILIGVGAGFMNVYKMLMKGSRNR